MQRFLLYTLDNATEGFSKLDESGKHGGANKTSVVINNTKELIS